MLFLIIVLNLVIKQSKPSSVDSVIGFDKCNIINKDTKHFHYLKMFFDFSLWPFPLLFTPKATIVLLFDAIDQCCFFDNFTWVKSNNIYSFVQVLLRYPCLWDSTNYIFFSRGCVSYLQASRIQKTSYCYLSVWTYSYFGTIC